MIYCVVWTWKSFFHVFSLLGLFTHTALLVTPPQVLSATAEDDARHLVEGATARKVVKTRQKKYLVKWRGLSYRECTWETVKDINDDTLIAEFHKINDSPPDEPPLTQVRNCG